MSEPALSNLPEFSVTELSAALKRAVEDQFAVVRVRGEISGLKFHSSGHVYFDLKDDKAVLNAVIWRTTTARLRVRPEAGMEVICTGKLSTYAGSSRYQIIVEQVELAGLGTLIATYCTGCRRASRAVCCCGRWRCRGSARPARWLQRLPASTP